MAFKVKLRPELVAQLEAESREMTRLYRLGDRWLAEELLRLTRQIRSRTAYASRTPDADSYNTTLLWDVIPEVAYRLGGRLELNEATNYDLKVAQGDEFRQLVAAYVCNCSSMYFREALTGAVLEPVEVLFHNYWNGCPIVMALDRVAPPGPDSDDQLASELREISKRRGHAETASWHPDLQEDGVREPEGILAL
jgi:hypothetical protein